MREREILERKHHLAYCIISTACQRAKYVAKSEIYCLKMNSLTKKKATTVCFISCQLLQCVFAVSQHVSCKYAHGLSINNLTCQLFASGITSNLIFFSLFYTFSLCLCKPKWSVFMLFWQLSASSVTMALLLLHRCLITTSSPCSLFGVLRDNTFTFSHVCLIFNQILTVAEDVPIN